jgi:hypothetical protein
MAEKFLDEKIRAEDIILGTLGFDTEAKIIKIYQTKEGFSGKAQWADGEQFDFQSEDELSELEIWALKILEKELENGKKN